MKKMPKSIIAALSIGIIISFFAGKYMKEQEYINDRKERCNTLISFAIDKAKNGNLSDQDTMEALISNIYAAYELCDTPNLSEQLHDLWNTLVFEDESYIGSKDVLVTQLRNIAEMAQIED